MLTSQEEDSDLIQHILNDRSGLCLFLFHLVFLLCHSGLGKNVPTECFPRFPPSHLSKQQYALCSAELAASFLRAAKTKVLFEEAEEI